MSRSLVALEQIACYLSVPAGLLCTALYVVGIPNGFPFQSQPLSERPRRTLSNLRTLDIIGALLFFCMSIFVVTALQEATNFYPWRSGLVISFLILSPLALIGLAVWEYQLHRRGAQTVPILSWEFADRRNIGLFA